MMEGQLIHFVDEENMWSDITVGLAFPHFWWGGEAETDDFYYEYYL